MTIHLRALAPFLLTTSDSTSAGQSSALPTRKLRVAFIDVALEPDKPGSSGLSDIVWAMAREFARLGDEVHIVAPYTVDPAYVEGIAVHRFSIPRPGYRNIVGHTRISLRALGVVRTLPPMDFIHAPEYLTTGLFTLLSSERVVLTTPGNIYERIANGNPYDWSFTQLLKIAARISARRCIMINAISKDMEFWWKRTGTPAQRIAVIPHGVDIERYKPIPGARASLSLPRDSTRFLFVGRLSDEKEIPTLMHAFAKLNQDSRPRLDLVGAGTAEPRLRVLAHGLGIQETVYFHGQKPKEEMPLWYAAADAVVLPSRSEGLPRAMMEAFASGTVFIGTRISGVQDHVRNGVNGFIVDVGDVEGLSACMVAVVDKPDEMNAIGDRARNYARSTFSWKGIVLEFRREVIKRLPAFPDHAPDGDKASVAPHRWST